MTQRIILGKTLRQHIGGRWAVSWQLYALNIPLNALAITTSIREIPTGLQWLGWIGVAIVGLIAIALVFFFASLTVLRHRRERPAPIAVVALVGAFAGMLRGSAVVVAASMWGLQPFSINEFVNRMLAGGLIGAAALPLGALTLSIVSTYRTERQRLIDERIAVERERLYQQGHLDSLRMALVDNVRGEVHETLNSVAHADPRTVSAAMREASHRIWPAGPVVPPRQPTRVRAVLWESFRVRPLPVLPIVALWTISAAGTLIAALGPARATGVLAYSFAVLWLALVIANRWKRRRPDQWALATGLMLVLSYCLISPVSYLLFDTRPLDAALPIMIMNAIWLPVVVIMIAISAGAVASSEVVLQRLADDVDAAEIERRALDRERQEVLKELATQLHGTAHSPMVAGTALLSQTGDSLAREHLIEYVGQAVAQLGTSNEGASLAERLASLASMWEGLVDVDVVIASSVDDAKTREAQRRLIERLTEEAITNAFRHGGASRVNVRVFAADTGLAIEVEDDGVGAETLGKHGLGFGLLDAVAPGNWSLRTHTCGGALLTVTLPR
jgi:signal transduction histidine kinase